MADLRYKVDVDVGGATQNLDRLKQNVGGLEQSFGKLKTLLGGLVAASTIRNLFSLSNALTDLSASTNISVQSIAGLGEALAQNGGRFDQANTAVIRFTETLGQAFEGSAKTQEAFARIGVSLEDLRTLSEQDLLRKTILGLGQVTDVGTRASLTAELFGRSLRGVDLAGVAGNLDSLTEQQREFAEAAQVAGDLNQRLGDTLRNLNNQVLIAIKPFIELAEAVTANTTALQKFLNFVVELGKIVLIAGAVLLLGKAIFALGAAFIGAGVAVFRLLSGIRNLFNILRNNVLTRAFLENLKAIPGVGDKVRVVINAMGTSIEKVKAAFGALAVGAAAAYAGLKSFFGFFKGDQTLNDMDAQLDSITSQFDELNRKTQEQRQVQEAAAKKAAEDAKRLREQIDGQIKSAEGILIAYRQTNAETQRRLEFENSVLRLTDQQKELKQAEFDAETTYLQEINRLLEVYNELRLKGANASDLKAVTDQLKAVTEEYQRQLPIVEQLVKARQDELRVLEDQRKVQQALESSTGFLDRLNESIRDAGIEFARMNLDGLDRQLFDIRNRINQDLSNEIKKLQALMTDTNAAEIQRQIDGITAASRAALEAQEELARRTFEQQRSFSDGWRKAFNEYRDNATNAARQAQRIFSTVTRTMEDAIVNFAKTGKFEFKNFVNVILEELLRIQIQRTFANIFGATGRSGSSGSNILGSLFGGFFATGGMIPPGRFGVVGERGPELVQGPVDVTPLTGTSVTYNINAVDASSFKALVARDPAFIHAVAMQGSKSMPNRR